MAPLILKVREFTPSKKEGVGFTICNCANSRTPWGKIGVLGGMGPMSTVLFYKYLIEICQEKFGAKYDSDFPEIFIYNLPIPDVVEGIEDERKTVEMLVQGIGKLEKAGCDFVAVPCNTLNFCLDFLRKKSKADVLSIVEETAKEVNGYGVRSVTLLATEKTIESSSYQNKLRGVIDLVLPENQAEVTEIISGIMAGSKDNKKLKKIIEGFEGEAVILGCTDLSVLISQKDVKVKIFDSLRILAEATIEKARVEK